jgi:hypothetical protein
MNILSGTGAAGRVLRPIHLLWLVGVLFIMGGTLKAGTLTAWTLSGTLDDGAIVSGSFDYYADPTNPLYSLINITLTNDPNIPDQSWNDPGTLPGGTALIYPNAGHYQLEIYFDDPQFHPPGQRRHGDILPVRPVGCFPTCFSILLPQFRFRLGFRRGCGNNTRTRHGVYRAPRGAGLARVEATAAKPCGEIDPAASVLPNAPRDFLPRRIRLTNC